MFTEFEVHNFMDFADWEMRMFNKIVLFRWLMKNDPEFWTSE